MMSRKRRVTLFLLILISCISADRITKRLATDLLSTRGGISVWQDTVRLQYAENVGAFLSLGETLPPTVRFWIFTASTAAMLTGMLIYLIVSPHLSPPSSTAIAFILAGGLSNLFDRVVNHGTVVDFLNVGIGNLRTGIFNVADMAITAGTLLLVCIVAITPRAEASREASPLS
jgi:signal peptidase II